MEKEQTTPDAYPMTLNALRAACNQKTNRDPVTDLDEHAVRDALESLRKDVLVWRSSGARAERWEHRLASRWELGASAQTILTLLMLRGPQTPGELRTRSERMSAFDNVEAVSDTLFRMTQGDHPLVRELPRQPGQSASRWMHLVGKSADDTSAQSATGAIEAASPQAFDGRTESASSDTKVLRNGAERLVALEKAVQQLADRVADLESDITGSDADTDTTGTPE